MSQNNVKKRRSDALSAKKWQEAKLKYIRTTVSWGELSKLTGIPKTTLHRHAAAEKWEEQREKYHRELDSRAMEESLDEDVKALNRLSKSASDLAEIIQLKICDEKNAEKSGEGFSSTKTLKEYAETVRLLVGVLRDIDGGKTGDELHVYFEDPEALGK